MADERKGWYVVLIVNGPDLTYVLDDARLVGEACVHCGLCTRDQVVEIFDETETVIIKKLEELLITDRFADGDPRSRLRRNLDLPDFPERRLAEGRRWRVKQEQGERVYAQLDFTTIDQRLGTLEELRALTEAAHELGMYVIVDVVMNHMANEFYFEGHEESSAPWRFHEGADGREYLLKPRSAEELLYDTPQGKQPYRDFWYDNTWDASATYNGTLYGQYGEWVTDSGAGTYINSDFHHNGDLNDYFDPWQINYGKIYGVMDDLRLEHERVQQKYIAMTKALIESIDVDGFRVDTPMQVPLNFYKVWAPAMRAHAKSLGKESFGIFGEFYVTPARYATMTGRGRDNRMYYWYIFTSMVYNDAQYADGLALAYREENKMIDTFDPMTQRKEYAMWNFCNNHDNWRLQSMTGRTAAGPYRPAPGRAHRRAV
eukprot:g29137.t1